MQFAANFAVPCTLPPQLLHLSSRPDPTQPLGERVTVSIALRRAYFFAQTT